MLIFLTFYNGIDGENGGEGKDFVVGIGDVQFITIAPGHPFFADGSNQPSCLADFILVLPKCTFHIPAEAFNAVARMEKTEFPYHLSYLLTAQENRIPGHPGQKFLLDIGNFLVLWGIDMELFAEREYFAFHEIAINAGTVFNSEFISPGEYFLFDIEFRGYHSFLTLSL